jgi:PKD repeat protein
MFKNWKCFFYFLFTIMLITLITTAKAQVIAIININGRTVSYGDTVNICQGNSLNYLSLSRNTSSVIWKFKNGSPQGSSASAVTVTYNTVGIDSTILTASGASGTDSTFIYVRVSNVFPTADFTYTPTGIVCGNTSFNFTNQSIQTGWTHLWNFGDGNTSIATNPVHSFLSAIGASGTQSFNVTLETTNSLGCKTTSPPQTITVIKIPDAGIGNGNGAAVTVSVYNGLTTFSRCGSDNNYNFIFTNTSTTTAINSEYTFEWGDFSPPTVLNSWPANGTVNHNYARGIHRLVVKVKEGTNNCIGIKEYNVFVGSTPQGALGLSVQNYICANDTFSFPVFGTGLNAAGTTYEFSFNDGSPTVIYQHPPPDTIKHAVLRSSCGITSGGVANSFLATLRIRNPCTPNPSPSTAGSLFVSGKPQADMRIQPSNIVCINSNVTILNTSLYGTAVVPPDNNCSETGKQVWVINPAAGFSIVSGTTGSLNGTVSNSANWTSGSNNLVLNFSVAGTYTVKLYVANPFSSCGLDSITRIICVRNPPQASFTMSSRMACNTGTASITNTSSAATCSGDTYTWAVTYLNPQGCGTGSNYTFINGTNAGSINPQIQFNSPGQYVITLTTTAVNASAQSCPPAIVRDTFTVKSKPKVVINPVNAVCVGNSISPAAAVSACYASGPGTYNWTFAGGTPSGSVNPIPGPVIYTATGTYPVILEVTNECGSSSDTVNVLITPPPTADAGTDKNVCSGEPVTIGSAAVAGITYQWAPTTGLNNAGIATPVATLTYNGPLPETTYMFIVTASAGANCSGVDTVFITVKKRPDVTVTALPLVVCQGDSSVLTASGASSYSWSPAATLSSAAGPVVIAKPTGTTVYSVVGTNNGCNDTAQVTVQVNNFPATNAGPDTTICNNTSSVQLVGTPAGGNWTGNFISPIGIFNAQAAGNGTYKIYYSYGSNNCNLTDSAIVTVANPPVASAGNDTTICQSNSFLQLNGLPVGGSWSGSPQISPAGQLNTSTGGIYTLIYTAGGGSCIDSDTIVVNVGAGVSNNTIDVARDICTGTPTGIINGGVPQGGGGGYTYQWEQSPNGVTGWTLIGGASGQNYDPGIIAQSACYRRKVTTQTCGNGLAVLSNVMCITIRPDARAGFTANDTVSCAGFKLDTAITVIPFAAGNALYNWYANGAPIGSNSTGVFPPYSISAACDTVDIKLVTTSLYGCKADSVTRRFITVCNVIPAFTKSSSQGCGPLDVSFTNTSSILDPSFLYRWNFGNGIVSNAIQPGVIRFNSSPSFRDTTYYITLKVYNGCDTVIYRDSVKVFPPSNARFAVDTTRGCSTFLPILTNESLGNNFIYYWNFGNGQLDTTTSLVRPRQPVYVTGVVDTFTIRLISENVCGRDTAETDIIVSPRTIQAQVAVSGTSLEGCAPHLASFNNGSIGAAQVIWNYGDGSTPDTTANAQATVQHLYTSPGTYQVIVRLKNDCTDTFVVRQVVVYAKPVVAFTLNKDTLCLGDSIITANNSVNANSYEWLWGDGTVTVGNNAVHTYIAAGSYTVRLVAKRISNLGIVCTDTALKQVLVVARIPAQIQVNNTSTSCAPYVLAVTAVGAAPAAQVRWTFYDNTVAPGQFFANGLSASYRFQAAGIYSVKLVVTNTAGCTDSITQSFTVNPTPVAKVQMDTIATCSRDTVIRCFANVQYSGTGPVNFVWYVDGVAVGTGNPYFHRFTVPAGLLQPRQFNVQVRPLSNAGCGDTSAGAVFTVQPLPRPKIRVSPTTLIRQPDYTFTFTDTNSVNINYNWLWSMGDQLQRSGNPVTHTYGNTGTYFVRLRLTDFLTGCSARDSVRVTIDKVPGYLYVPNAFYPNSLKNELRTFLPKGRGLLRYLLQVYDGQGKLLFETTALDADGRPSQGWDGTFRGQAMSQDAYLWVIKIADFKNGTEWDGMKYSGDNKPRSSGSITLFR